MAAAAAPGEEAAPAMTTEAATVGGLPVLLMSANTGTLFEQYEALSKGWLGEVVSTIAARKPVLFALHFQEVGGKAWATSMHIVQGFVDELCAILATEHGFSTRCTFMDMEFEKTEEFTALGSVYCVHESVADSAQIWNFQSNAFEAAKPVAVAAFPHPNAVKAKFSADMYCATLWTRKGYLQTRWKINGRDLNLVNAHLFHDASNLVAMQATPSRYATCREQALRTTLAETAVDDPECRHFVFGDLNFRLSAAAVVPHLAKGCAGKKVEVEGDDMTKLVLTATDGSDRLTVQAKLFRMPDSGIFIASKDEFRQFDGEAKAVEDILSEFEIGFECSYAYSEEAGEPDSFLEKRCPAWCDRVLIANKTFEAVSGKPHTYELVGRTVCMGDHKPVYLYIEL